MYISESYQINFLELEDSFNKQDVLTLKMDKNMKKEQSGSLLFLFSQKELLNTFTNSSVILSKIDSDTYYQFEVTNQHIELTNLDVGDYLIYIKGQYPKSYKIHSYKVHIDNQKLTTIQLNQSTQPIIIKKVDMFNHSLKGAQFRILDKDKKIIMDNLTSDSHGFTLPFELPPDIYFIEEIKAPDGYVKSNKLIPFEVIE